jgi:hypothetical protein
MSAEPQHNLEHDLRAYKQRRTEQLGAPIELHPATRKMLQGEATRAVSRPLLTSEEAAKNFVRSFVMSHQQPGFFARHKPQLLWGGGMFACLAIVLLVLRNDPQQAARQNTFSDALPAPPAAPTPTPTPAAKPASLADASERQVEAERLSEQLSRVKRAVPAEEGVLPEAGKLSGAPVSGPAPTVASPRGSTIASGPTPVVRRESEDRRNGAANAPLPAAPTMPASDLAARAPTSAGRFVAENEAPVNRALLRDADRKLPEKGEAGATVQVAKALKATESAVLKRDLTDKDGDVAKLKLKSSDEMKRAQTLTRSRPGGGFASGAPAPMAPAAPAVAMPGEPPAATPLAFGAVAADEAGQTQQRFQQLNQLAAYRRNFNSPPVPEVMKDFAFERTGNRVRIVDADGSTYEGTVQPVLAEEFREKQTAAFEAAKERKASLEPAAQSQRADAASGYRFHVSGVNRKLNQSVEFRGEWQPAAPAPAPADMPGLRATSFGLGAVADLKEVEKKKAPATNALADQSAVDRFYYSVPSQKGGSQGSISGRAVVGGKSEFDIKAVTK